MDHKVLCLLSVLEVQLAIDAIEADATLRKIDPKADFPTNRMLVKLRTSLKIHHIAGWLEQVMFNDKDKTPDNAVIMELMAKRFPDATVGHLKAAMGIVIHWARQRDDDEEEAKG